MALWLWKHPAFYNSHCSTSPLTPYPWPWVLVGGAFKYVQGLQSLGLDFHSHFVEAWPAAPPEATGVQGSKGQPEG